MKTCPVCEALAFDDAPICYGCLHRFGEEDAHSEAKPIESVPYMEYAESGADLPVFSIRFTPELVNTGGVTWRCSVELA